MDLALNNLQWIICQKKKTTNQPKLTILKTLFTNISIDILYIHILRKKVCVPMYEREIG